MEIWYIADLEWTYRFFMREFLKILKGWKDKCGCVSRMPGSKSSRFGRASILAFRESKSLEVPER